MVAGDNIFHSNPLIDEVKSLREGIKQARKEHQELQSQLSESRASETTSKVGVARIL